MKKYLNPKIQVYLRNKMEIQKKRLCIHPLFIDLDNSFSICKCSYLEEFGSSFARCKDIKDKEVKKFHYNLDYGGISATLDALFDEGKKFNEIYNLYIPHFLLSNNLHPNEVGLLTRNITNHNESVINEMSVLNRGL